MSTCSRTQEVGADRYEQADTRFHISMFLVTKAFGGRIYNPSQLTQFAKTSLEISAESVKAALEILVEKANEIGEEEGWALDRVAKSKAFVETVAELALEP